MGIASEALRILHSILDGYSLTPREASLLAEAMLNPSFDDTLKAAALAALRAKGEAPTEVAGFAAALRMRAVRVESPRRPLLDTAGTGGDGAHTINASTAAALVAASLGVATAKHGNRSISSRSGSADVMEALGYNIGHGPETAARMLGEIGFTFLYAPRYHPAMKAVMPVRRRLATRTIFNLVGPLANPAGNDVQVLGVARRGLAPLMAAAAALLGYERVLVVHGAPGIDEVSVTGETLIIEVERGRVGDEYTVDPESLGVRRAELSELRVEGSMESAERIRRALAGKGRRCDADFIAANAGAALYAAGAVKSLRDGVEAALQAMGEARPLRLLDAAVKASRGG